MVISHKYCRYIDAAYRKSAADAKIAKFIVFAIKQIMYAVYFIVQNFIPLCILSLFISNHYVFPKWQYHTNTADT